MEIINAGEAYSALKLTVTARNATGDERHWSGTGFLLVMPGTSEPLCLVTNRHVFYPHCNHPAGERDPPASIQQIALQYWSLEGEWQRTGPQVRTVTYTWPDSGYLGDTPDHEAEDIAACRIERANYPEGEPLLLHSQFLISADEYGSLDVGQQVLICGYPGFMNGAERPIVRTGFLASDPFQSFKHAGQKSYVSGRALAYDGMSFGGLSGSPVFVAPRRPRGMGRPARILGINAGHVTTDDGSHAGISYLFTAAAVSEAITKAVNSKHELRKT